MAAIMHVLLQSGSQYTLHLAHSRGATSAPEYITHNSRPCFVNVWPHEAAFFVVNIFCACLIFLSLDVRSSNIPVSKRTGKGGRLIELER